MRNVFTYHGLYRVAVCLMVLPAMAAAGFGGGVCFQVLLSERVTTFTAIICLFPLAGAVVLFVFLPAYAIKVLSWKLTVSKEGFMVTEAWRQYSVPFKVLDEYRIDALGIFIKSRSKLACPVFASFFISDYPALALLVRRHLGTQCRDVCNSRGRIFENKLLAGSPEAAIVQFHRSILLYYTISAVGWSIGLYVSLAGYPYWLSSIVGGIPLICVWAIVHTKGLISFYAKRDYYTYRPEFFQLMLFACSILALRLVLDYALHPDGLVWPIAFCVGLLLYLALTRTAFYRAGLRTSQPMRWLIPALCLAYGYWLTIIMINCQLDSSPGEQQAVEVTSKKVASSLLPTPMVELDIWNRGNPTPFIMLTLSQYDSLSTGDHVVIGVHRGVLGIPWYRRSYSVFNEGELEIPLHSVPPIPSEAT